MDKFHNIKWLLKAFFMLPLLVWLRITKALWGSSDFDYIWNTLYSPGVKTHWRLLWQ